MPKVSNLKIKIQSGTTSTCFASWEFKENTKSTTANGRIRKGDLVSIKSGATYYNGVAIPSWVMKQKWYITQVKGDRAVLGKNESGTNNIVSPINTKYLSGGSGSGDDDDSPTAEEIKTLDHYTVTWHYDTGDGVWFSGGESDTKEKNATYSAPSNANRIKVDVKPVSQTHEVNNKEVSYWNGTTASYTYSTSASPPEKLSAPTVTLFEKYALTASVENISDPRTDEVEFQICDDTHTVRSRIVKVLTARATYVFRALEAGVQYRVRCASINIDNNSKIYGEWSDYSSRVSTMPSAPSKITRCQATSKTSVRLDWTKVNSAKTYDMEYTTDRKYFDGSNKTTTVTGIEYASYEITGLETGNEYFFRVRAVNDQGNSLWCGIASVVIGKDPAAPTTWSSTTTAVSGEPLTLYWVHNSEDGSSQTYAELELYINGTQETHTIKNTEDEDEKDKTSSYSIDTSQFIEGSTIQWRVRTAGVTKSYGDWSVQRTIDIYAPATLTLSMTDANNVSLSTLNSFPFYISAFAGPKTQAPVSYHLTIRSNEIYETVDQIGNPKTVNAGEEIYSKYFDTSEPLIVELSAGNIDLENNISYTVTCVVSMNSGLTCTESLTFDVQWEDIVYEPDAEIGIDEDTYTAYIRPYCIDDNEDIITDVLLSVYRREYDGSFVELAVDLENGTNVHITDPHPALDYARYRIVATSKTNGSVSYYDPPGYPVQCKSVIIQWDEAWSTFDTDNSDPMSTPVWAGSMLKLPYNIDVSDDNSIDVSLVKYIGRKNPVSYYGTQIGSSSTWNVEIEKTDIETLYALRRLSIWAGDVYVREPFGSGYWAQVKVTYSLKHKALTVPVTFSITRVEGGM